MNRTIFSNGLWNVLGGMSSAIVAVLVPPFLTRALPPEAYGAWAVALQLGTYVNLFGLGIQTAVGRYVAYHHGPDETGQRDSIVASAFWSVLVASLAGIAIIACIAANTDRLFPQLSGAWRLDSAVATAVLGVSFGVGLIGSVFGSVFLGLQKSHVPAMAQLFGRVAQAGLLIAAARTHSLTIMAIAHLVGSIGISGTLFWLWRNGTRQPTVSVRLVSRWSLKELGSFCLSLTVWNLAMLLISGLDLVILTRYDFHSVPYYAVSLTLVSFIAGTLQALSAALTPAAAQMQGNNAQIEMQTLFLRATGLISVASMLISAPLIFAGRPILALWVGPIYADHAHAILMLLAAATVIRTCLLGYVMIAIGTGQQRRMIFTPLIEGTVSIFLSIWWAKTDGVMGIATAKLVSATVGVVLLIIQHPLSQAIPAVSRMIVIRDCLVRPAFFWLILTTAMFLLAASHWGPLAHLSFTMLAIAVVALFASWGGMKNMIFFR